jgi:hypothetical protein
MIHRTGPNHSPRRAKVTFVEPAVSQLGKLTAAQVHALDRAVVALSVRPDIGCLSPDGRLRDYRDDLEEVRVIYFVTALQTVVVVTYLEA